MIDLAVLRAARAFAVVAVLASLASASGAEPFAVDEYRLKAAYLYNFAQFIEWPDEAEAEADPALHVCVLGTDPFGSALDETLRQRRVRGQRLTVHRIPQATVDDECEIVFISRSLRDALGPVLASAQRRGALTISELDGFARAGGMIELTERRAKVGFTINLDAANRARLRISSQLLELAVVIGDSNAAEGD